MQLSYCLPVIAVLASATVPGAVTAQGPSFALETVQALPDAELAQQRGGFEIAGLTIGLGADLRTYLNGELALRTVVTWSAAGQSKDVWSSPALTPAAAAQLQGALPGGPISLNLNDVPVFFANNGATALAQRVDGGLQNILLNTASNTAITQQADITLDLGNYATFAATMSASLAGSGMGDTLSAAATAAAHF